MRYFCELSYLGTHYHGWQTQSNAHTVQDEIEHVLGMLINERVTITASGRTDTGVHAIQQFFHFDTSHKINPDKIVYKLNSVLPKDIAIKKLVMVHPDAHARFDAIRRRYKYQINLVKDPFRSGFSYAFYKNPDVELMNEAACKLLGERDFQCFSKVKTEVNNFLCNVVEAKWVKGSDEITFYIAANRFLRGMVRAIVGTLLLVGEKRISPNDFEEIILSKDRKKAGRSVPPDGLYLMEVSYSDKIYSL